MKVKNIPTELIKYPKVILRSPEDMTGIDELAKSIQDDGLLHPLVVVQKGDEYELLAGGRRFEAIKTLGWERIPCNVISPSEDKEKLITLIENQKRDQLNPLEEAQYYEYLEKELGMEQVKIAELAGTSPAHVNQILKLLTLDEYTMGALAAGDISASQARELTRCPDEPYRQYLVDTIKKSGVSVLLLKRWVDEKIGFQSQNVIYQKPPTPEVYQDGGDVNVVTCELCGAGLEYGGLQSIMACNECYKKLKQAIEDGGATKQEKGG